jgi:hypothetical protein
LLAAQGRRDEARTMLADFHDWFAEGLDTADLKGAKALLDQLNARIAGSVRCLNVELFGPMKRRPQGCQLGFSARAIP